MDIEEIKNTIRELSCSQGFYGRMFNYLEENDLWYALKEAADENEVTDRVGLILMIEG